MRPPTPLHIVRFPCFAYYPFQRAAGAGACWASEWYIVWLASPRIAPGGYPGGCENDGYTVHPFINAWILIALCACRTVIASDCVAILRPLILAVSVPFIRIMHTDPRYRCLSRFLPTFLQVFVFLLQTGYLRCMQARTQTRPSTRSQPHFTSYPTSSYA